MPERLPTTVAPTGYRIELSPDLKEFTFTGRQEIDVVVTEPTKVFVLHAAELTISDVAVESDGGTPENVQSFDCQEAFERLELVLASECPAGRYTIRLRFQGTLNDRLVGFYRSNYEVKGVAKIMGTTQFEACDARRAFPCFDEPAIRATFQISMIVDTYLTAISNMPVVSEEPCKAQPSANKKLVKFDTSPPTSSYIVGFCVSELDFVSAIGPRGIPIRVYTTPGKSAQANFALEVAVKSLTWLEQFFGIDYPLPKLDLLAVPDFSIGAMENWGLLTFRETALLMDAQLSSTATKTRVAYIISHELSHMWFGNLVSIEWWSQLWLKEGFATYFGWAAVDGIYPEWGVWMDFLTGTTNTALDLDELTSTHPVEVEVTDENQINEAFDAISYRKGASIIRMLAAYLGKDCLRKGLSAYLKKYAYSSASTADLWQSLQEASGKPVASTMCSWTQQPGFPLLVAGLSTSAASGLMRIHIGQQAFGSSSNRADWTNGIDGVLNGSTSGAKSSLSWHVPVGMLYHR
jgi:puromycin-sensitive aminopeptidase